jgi:hypothetical protein
MPAKYGVGCDDGGNLLQRFPAESLALGCESSSLVVGEPESLPAELFLEDSILFAQILNRGLLMLVDLASEDRDEELPWLKDPGHPGILRSKRHSASLPFLSQGG